MLFIRGLFHILNSKLNYTYLLKLSEKAYTNRNNMKYLAYNDNLEITNAQMFETDKTIPFVQLKH